MENYDGRGRSAPRHPRTAPGFGPLWLAFLVLTSCTSARQSPDDDFRYPIATPRYEAGTGPRVGIDEAHGNFHTASGRFAPFARLLRDDGYTVEPFVSPLSAESLAEVDVLVIANSLAEENRIRWRLPNHSAFSTAEIEALRVWLEGGGALLLIADHMPFPGAAETLAAELGVFFTNGYAQDGEGNGHIVFRRDQETLRPHPITDGTDPAVRVDQVKVFTGQAFRIATAAAEPILVMPEGSRVLLPSKPRDFSERTPYVLAEGLLQGATLRIGEGRVAVFGEAAMFTSQLAVTPESTTRFGMSAPGAEDNPRFVLNVLDWLGSSSD